MSSTKISDQGWKELLSEIRNGNVIPIIGSELSKIEVAGKEKQLNEFLLDELVNKNEIVEEVSDFTQLKHSITETYNRPTLEIQYSGPIKDEPEKFAILLRLHEMQITNGTIYEAIDVVYRLYKDSKFFYNLKESVDDYEGLMKKLEDITVK